MHDVDLVAAGIAEVSGADVGIVAPGAGNSLLPALADKNVHLLQRSIVSRVLGQLALCRQINRLVAAAGKRSTGRALLPMPLDQIDDLLAPAQSGFSHNTSSPWSKAV